MPTHAHSSFVLLTQTSFFFLILQKSLCASLSFTVTRHVLFYDVASEGQREIAEVGTRGNIMVRGAS